MSRVGPHAEIANCPAGHTLHPLHTVSRVPSQRDTRYCAGPHSQVHGAHVRSRLLVHADAWYCPGSHAWLLHAAHRRSLPPPQSPILYVSGGHALLHALQTGGAVGVQLVAVYDPLPHLMLQVRHALLPALEYVPGAHALQYPSRLTSSVQRNAIKSPTNPRVRLGPPYGLMATLR